MYAPPPQTDGFFSTKVKVQWRDEDGELITIATDADLEEAIAAAAGKPVKLVCCRQESGDLPAAAAPTTPAARTTPAAPTTPVAPTTETTPTTESVALAGTPTLPDLAARLLTAPTRHVWTLQHDVLHSDNIDDSLFATTMFRKLLCEKRPEGDDPIQDVIDLGVVPRFVEFLKRSEMPQLQFEAAWALTNIASGALRQTTAVIDAGAIPVLVDLLESPADGVREQAVWALGNIAGNGPGCRDRVLQAGALAPLLRVLNDKTSKVTMMRNAAWTLSNLCRGKNFAAPDFAVVSESLQTLARLVYHTDDDVLADACRALSYLTDGTNDKIQKVVEAGVGRRLVELLMHDSSNVITPALRSVGNIVTGDHVQTQVVLNYDLLPALFKLTAHSKESIKKEACRTISNITAGSQEQIQAVIDGNLIPPVVYLLQNSDFKTRKEAAWAISNATSGGRAALVGGARFEIRDWGKQIQQLVAAGCIPPLCNILATRDHKVAEIALDALNNILRVGVGSPTATGDNPYALEIEECGGVPKIEAIRLDSCIAGRQGSMDFYDLPMAAKIISKYFAPASTSTTQKKSAHYYGTGPGEQVLKAKMQAKMEVLKAEISAENGCTSTTTTPTTATATPTTATATPTTATRKSSGHPMFVDVTGCKSGNNQTLHGATVKVLQRVGKSYIVENQSGVEHKVQIRSTAPSPPGRGAAGAGRGPARGGRRTSHASKPTHGVTTDEASETLSTTSTLTTCTFGQGDEDDDEEEGRELLFAEACSPATEDVFWLNTQSVFGQTALMVAAEGYLEVMQTLLKAGGNAIDFGLVNENGYTALMLAAQANQIDIVNALIAARTTQLDEVGISACAAADPHGVNLQTVGGATALMAAADGGHLEVIEALLKAGGNAVDHSLVDCAGFTAIMTAASVNQIDILNRLIASREAQLQANAL